VCVSRMQAEKGNFYTGQHNRERPLWGPADSDWDFGTCHMQRHCSLFLSLSLPLSAANSIFVVYLGDARLAHNCTHTHGGKQQTFKFVCCCTCFPLSIFFWPPFNGDLYLYLNLKAIWLSPHRSHTP